MRYRAQIATVTAVTAWAIFAYAYLGVEDGSSGLSVLGWLHAMFFIPGGILMQVLRGSHSNADLPFMTGVSWLTYSAVGLAITHVPFLVRKHKEKRANQ